ncbi:MULTISPECIES: EAL domain-containing protein [Methylomonas]|uniref:Diguanylate phosphodiesterase n=2 Tax=Methylomonas TaxID=416 RepID=A0A126T7T3_9GAMM|nr:MULTISPECIES: EAL domain-containing protein [Methylomonas]AMK78100.1 diguanylate phosphodiesterase [Methylomonas denitrificans]OAH96501.1 diguanylate phosphodiesterase [Methylomonas methanica]TCV85636.1 EAL domain-containing protein (putative c-di-GMP-specific phosphodiesterase class I) [Methylomonas methanica]
MVENTIELLRDDLERALYLDLDEFKLEIEQQEVLSRFIGLKLRSEFQPIFDAGKSQGLLGYEALLRTSTGLEAVSPDFAFSWADNQGKLVKLDRVARTLHMLNYLNLPADKGLLFLNVHPKLLVSVNTHGKVFEHILHLHSVPTTRVVLEIMENAVEADQQLLEAVDNYRDRGFQVAIDNFGSRHSNLDRLWRLSPSFVKLDLSIIHQAQTDAKIRRVLPKLIEIIQALGAQAIIEGIENEVQLDIALDAGGKLLQGYFLGRPAAAGHWQRPRSVVQDNPLMPGAPQHFGSFSVPAQNGM